jgi:hypothetical protein
MLFCAELGRKLSAAGHDTLSTAADPQLAADLWRLSLGLLSLGEPTALAVKQPYQSR